MKVYIVTYKNKLLGERVRTFDTLSAAALFCKKVGGTLQNFK